MSALRIASIAGFDSYWGKDLPPDLLRRRKAGTVGGGEEAALETAYALASFGHDVHLWWYGQGGEWVVKEEAFYVGESAAPRVHMHSLADDLYGRLEREHWDAVIGWSTLRPLEAVEHKKETKRFYAQQLNDLLQQGRWSAVDCIISPSESHAQQLPGWGWKKKPYAVVNNGLHPWRHASATLWKERPLTVGYWSSPDRGLHHLLRAWPEIHKQVPDAKLHVFYELDRYLGFATKAAGLFGDRARLLLREVAKAKCDPSIVFRGAVDREELAEFQNQCRVQAYPYQPVGFCEGFGGAVNQGIAAGCNVLLTPYDAFPELYEGYVTWLPKGTKEMCEALPGAVISALRTPPTKDGMQRAYFWQHAGRQLHDAICERGWKLTNDAPEQTLVT